MPGASKRLDRLIESLNNLGTGQPLHQLNRRLGKTSLELVERGFETGRAPSGRRWPRPKIGLRYRPMIRTGRLSKSYRLEMRDGGFEIVSPVHYAKWLQKGVRGHMKPRKQVPGRSLPARWEKEFRRQARAWIRRVMERSVVTVE